MSLTRPAVLASLLLLVSGAGSSPADVPAGFAHRGQLLESPGVPRSEPTTLTFRIYEDEVAAAAMYVQTSVVQPDLRGFYQAILGDDDEGAAPVPDAVFDASERYLSVAIDEAGGGGEGPRARILPVALAHGAQRAARLDRPREASVQATGTPSENGAALAEALARAAAEATSAEPFLVHLGPGVYERDQAYMVASHVFVRGSGAGATRLVGEPPATFDVAPGVAEVEIRQLAAWNTAPGGEGLRAAAGASVLLRGCAFESAGHALVASGAELHLERTRVRSLGGNALRDLAAPSLARVEASELEADADEAIRWSYGELRLAGSRASASTTASVAALHCRDACEAEVVESQLLGNTAVELTGGSGSVRIQGAVLDPGVTGRSLRVASGTWAVDLATSLVPGTVTDPGGLASFRCFSNHDGAGGERTCP